MADFQLSALQNLGWSPNDLFTRIRWPISNFQHYKTWGCPVYVLSKKIQDGQKLPRWSPRSTRQMYLGFSPKHASSVPLCLNLSTGAVSPQYHVVFDEDFTTIATDVDKLPDFNDQVWQEMFGTSRLQYAFDDDDDPPVAVDVSEPSPITARDTRVAEAVAQTHSPIPLPLPTYTPPFRSSSPSTPTHSSPLADPVSFDTPMTPVPLPPLDDEATPPPVSLL